MTTQARSFIKFSLVSALLFSASAFAQSKYCPKSFEVLERVGKKDYTFEERQLENLYCNDRFEGQYFKIVYATEDEAIAFNHPNEVIRKKAANVYYHLSIARNFWMKEVKSDYVASLPQIIVRIDITNAFSNSRHYKNAEQEKNYNNAWSIPSGSTPSVAAEKKNWGKEIWFSPAKKIDAREEIVSDGSNAFHQTMEALKDPIMENNKNALIYAGLNYAVTPTVTDGAVVNLAIQRVAVVAVLFTMLEASKHMDKWFVSKWFYIDTAMIPDIIYHEYAHIAMSDTMKTVHSIPVIEGMADYFATRVSNRDKVYNEIKTFSNNRAKNARNKDYYHPYLEGSWNATSDFTLSLLWLGRREFEKVNAERVSRGQLPVADYDQLIFETHRNLDENSDIMNDLNRALINACKEKCNNVRAGINTFNSVFEQKGFN
jgi:hypothetical protein